MAMRSKFARPSGGPGPAAGLARKAAGVSSVTVNNSPPGSTEGDVRAMPIVFCGPNPAEGPGERNGVQSTVSTLICACAVPGSKTASKSAITPQVGSRMSLLLFLAEVVLAS